MSSGRFASLVNPDVLTIKPYTPGKPVEELARERGLPRIVKLASNENPMGAAPAADKALAGAAAQLNRYPDGAGFALKSRLGELWNLPIDHIALGNGSSEIIEMIVRLVVGRGKSVVLASPSFSIYEITVKAQGGRVVSVPLDEAHRVDLDAIGDALDETTALVIVGNPNNPTGTIFGTEPWERFLDRVPPHVTVLLDEAYAEFVDPEEDFPVGRDYLADDRPLIVARTFSKAYGLAAVRIGYGLAPPEFVDYMNRLRLPFNANALAQAAALASLDDQDYLERSIAMTREGRERILKFFTDRGIEALPSQANFLVARVGEGDRFFREMLDEGVIVRSAAGFGMAQWARISVGTPAELDYFEAAAAAVLRRMGANHG